MADGHFVDAVFIPGIDLLGGAEHPRDRDLLQVPVLAELAKDFPVSINIEKDAIKDCYSLRTFYTRCETPTTKWAREHGYNVVTTDHVVVKDKAVEPTYVKTGLTEGSHCSVCGEVLEAQKVVPKLVAKKVNLNSKKATCKITVQAKKK